jgi:hypothetical protein
MELNGLDFNEPKNVFKTMVLISSTKISKKTPSEFITFVDETRDNFVTIFDRATLKSIKSFMDDAYAKELFVRFFVQTGELEEHLSKLNGESRLCWEET